jgi:surface polysaccharide O-acyltransferase-like enzyme
MSTSVAEVVDVSNPGAPAPRVSNKPRLEMFDCLRVMAAYAIIWLHTPRSEELAGSGVLGRFAVPFFACATVFFVWKGLVDKPGQSLPSYVRSRFIRIYVPFLAWSVIYLLFKAVKGVALPNQPNDFPGLEFLWTGSFYHLWFLPFIFVASIAVFALGKLVIGKPAAEITAAMLCLAAGEGFALAPIPASLAGGQIELVWHALPAVFWGITLSVAFHRGAARWLQTSATALVGLTVAVACIAWTWRFGRNTLAENVAGLSCVLVALAPWSTRVLARIGQMGPRAYGIYLSHLLFIKSSESVLNKLHVSVTPAVDIGVFAVAVLGSTALTWVLSRFRATRWLVA